MIASPEGDSASKSEHHGYFDNDWVTMNSVMRRILAIPDSTPLPCPHLPEPDDPASTFPTSPERDLRRRASAHALAAATHAGGRRSAVCIGIDDYGVQSLNGCVADAKSWATALTSWGFAVTRLTNGDATRQRIMDAMESVLAKSAAGDVVVIQYAGHGTQVPDGNGDESDGLDEAWVPHDFEQGEFVIDDDIGALFDRFRNSGIQLVVFTDCCHSGSSTRLLFRSGAPELERHSRYMRVPPEIVARFSVKRDAGQSGARFGGQDSLGWEIHYAACQDRQSAYEHGGHGDFTSAATKAMAKVAGSSMTYQSLAGALEQAFSGNPDQTPQLRAPTGIGARPLFGSTRDIADGAASAGAPATAPASSDIGALIAATERLSAAVDALSKKIDDL